MDNQEPDAEYWGRMATWTFEQAISLALNREPGSDGYLGRTDKTAYDYRDELKKLRGQVDAARNALEFADDKNGDWMHRVRPEIFLAWCDRYHRRFPQPIRDAVAAHSGIVRIETGYPRGAAPKNGAEVKALDDTGGQLPQNPLEEVNWSLLMALAWIMWRSLDRVQRVSVRTRQFPVTEISLDSSDLNSKPRLLRQDAHKQLWQALAAGRLIGTGVNKQTERRENIDSTHWQGLKIQYAGAKLDLYLEGEGRCFFHPTLLSADILRLWPSPDSSKGGRPPEWNWDELKQVALEILRVEGVPSPITHDPEWRSNSDLARRVQDWCMANHQEQPGLSTVRGKTTEWIKAFNASLIET
jgi:hypothetical protein